MWSAAAPTSVHCACVCELSNVLMLLVVHPTVLHYIYVAAIIFSKSKSQFFKKLWDIKIAVFSALRRFLMLFMSNV